eukprot:1187595-Prorocentrum_minimum.AAC.1
MVLLIRLRCLTLHLVFASVSICHCVDVTLSWDFESGTFSPHWRLMNHGLFSERGYGAPTAPDFGVVDLLCVNGTCADGASADGKPSIFYKVHNV